MKKYLSLVLVLLMMLACLPAHAAVTEKGVLPIVDEPITLTIAFPVPAKVDDITTNEFTLWLEEQTGINLEFIEMSTTDVATQVNMLMNSGDLPDIFLGYYFPYDQLCSYADAGLIAPLDEQYEKYGNYVYDVIVADLGPNTLSYVTYDDHLWAVPSGGLAATDHYLAYNNRIQTTFLDALNMEIPTTIDELYDYLVAVRDEDVNGNGDPDDEIPMSAHSKYNYAFATLSQAWQYTDTDTFLKQNDGTISFIGNNAEFKEALEFVKKLIDEKLLDPASFTQDESVIAAQVAQDGNHIGLFSSGYMIANYIDSTSEEYATLRLMPNLEGPHGYKSSLVQSADVQITGVITTDCENVDAAFRLLDFLLAEESSGIARLGFEGKQWTRAADGVLGRNGEQAWYTLLTTQEWVQPNTNVIWCSGGFWHTNVTDHIEATNTTQIYPPTADLHNWNLIGEETGEKLPKLLMEPETALEYEEYKTMIVDYVNNSIAMFVLGDRSIEDDWDDYCAELESMGLARYVELAQSALDAM